MDYEGDVITGRHGQHLPLDAHPQAPGWQQRAGVLLGALLLVHSPLAHVGDHLSVPATQHTHRTNVRARGVFGTEELD